MKKYLFIFVYILLIAGFIFAIKKLRDYELPIKKPVDTNQIQYKTPDKLQEKPIEFIRSKGKG